MSTESSNKAEDVQTEKDTELEQLFQTLPPFVVGKRIAYELRVAGKPEHVADTYGLEMAELLSKQVQSEQTRSDELCLSKLSGVFERETGRGLDDVVTEILNELDTYPLEILSKWGA